jgi:hypothetical protein
VKIAAFLQLRNELENGNLVRCLGNCRLWADDIFIYDDASTDDSRSIYLDYTPQDHIICGDVREFDREIYHKSALLSLVLSGSPDWVVWIDGDAILDRGWTNEARQRLSFYGSKGYDHIFIHNLNLWRSPCYYRKDNSFNDLNPPVFWKNTGKLNYRDLPGLHQQQYPDGMELGVLAPGNLLHYGFASYENIVRKYLTYKSYGQYGWSLNRLIDESTLSLERVPDGLYPEDNIPVCDGPMPSPISFDEVREFVSWESYQKSLIPDQK